VVTLATDGLEGSLLGTGGHAWQRLRERTDDLGVKFSTGTPPQLAERIARRPRPTIRARARDCIVRVGNMDDPRRERDVVAA
jgi:hypothetical protein